MKLFPKLSAALLFATTFPASAQVPVTLEHSIPPPSIPQAGAQLGYSVAMDGNYTVCGAPAEDLGGVDQGVVKVFDSTTGALLHVLPNPRSEYSNYRFGSSVSISGTWVVVGNSEAYEATGSGFSNSGKVFIFNLASPTPTVPVHTLINPSPTTGDFFGNAVAISGSRVVIGARQDDEGAVNAGRAYVYDLASGTPTVPVETLNNPAPTVDDSFGWSVAISGTRVVVGAYLDDFDAPDAGRVYVYDLDLNPATLAIPAFTLNKPTPAASDWFGVSVAVEGDKVVVGALLDDISGTDSGRAYLYNLAGNTPTLPVSALTNPAPSASDLFGYSVAIFGNRVAVGAYQEDPEAITNAGSAYVYNITYIVNPALVHTLNNPTPAIQDYFGVSVALSGNRLAVGAYLDDTGATDAGSVYLHDLAGATPGTPSVVLNHLSGKPEGDFGFAVAISGDLMVVGAPTDTTGALLDGSAYVFNLASPTPAIPILVLNNPSSTAYDLFGHAVAIDGTRIVVGATLDNTGAGDAGIAYVFDVASSTPQVPVFVLNNPNPLAYDQFGWSVAIDGNLVAVGTPWKTVGATLDAGTAYIFNLAGGAVPLLPSHTIQNPGLGSDAFGNRVALSGHRLVVGAPDDNTGAPDAGRAYIYEIGDDPTPPPSHILPNPSPTAADLFGWSVAISGSRVLIGAPQDQDSAGVTREGSAYLFDILGTAPTVPILTFGNPTPAEDDYFGRAVAIAGEIAVIGAFYDDSGAVDAGSAYVYDISGAGPTVPVATLNNPTPDEDDRFGRSVAMDGSRVVVGAPKDDSVAFDRGFAYVFGIGETDFQIVSTIPPCLVGPQASIAGSIASGTFVINQIRYSIDGGPVVIVSNPGIANPSFNIDLSTLANGPHTIVITATAAGGTVRSFTASFHRDQIALAIAKGVIMTWSCGVLQTSTNGVNWTDVPGATSPFAVPTNEPSRVWQVRYE